MTQWRQNLYDVPEPQTLMSPGLTEHTVAEWVVDGVEDPTEEVFGDLIESVERTHLPVEHDSTTMRNDVWLQDIEGPSIVPAAARSFAPQRELVPQPWGWQDAAAGMAICLGVAIVFLTVVL